MKRNGQQQESTTKKWHPPLNIEHYDRRVALPPGEMRALRRHVHEHHPAKRSLHDKVRRLIEPIDDVFAYTKLRECVRPFLLLYVLREIDRRGRTFWGWTAEEWIETIEKHDAQQQHLIALAYLLCEFTEFNALQKAHIFYVPLAQKVFSRDCLDPVLERVCTLLQEWGYSRTAARRHIPRTLCEALLANRSPRLEDLNIEVLKAVQRKRDEKGTKGPCSAWLVAISRVLARFGIIHEPLQPMKRTAAWLAAQSGLTKNVPAEWARFCRYWFDTSTVCLNSRRRSYYFLLNIGRWVGHQHPEATSPAQWTRSLGAECVALVTQMRSGDWTEDTKAVRNLRQPLAANSKAASLSIVRRFFRDLQNWEAIPRRFDPLRAFATPKTVIAQIGPNPRVIADDLWAKLVWAGLNLTVDDLPRRGGRAPEAQRKPGFRFELVRAFVITWLFSGLRINEIIRLRLGCIRWQPDNMAMSDGEQKQRDQICFLEVPVNKTGRAFTKPVDRIVGKAISDWEKIRPVQAKLTDPKTGELVDFLFLDGMRRFSVDYLNHSLIPILCRKAGIPTSDVRGRITSHRARSTIASQLFNAKEPMTLFELQKWLGHSSPEATQHYATITATKLAKSYADAGYFARNLRAVEVLIDQAAVKSGIAVHEAWKYYDLGHGYCTYDFFEQCPHRMACAKCAFYLPKDSTKAQILEAKENLLRLRQEIPLAEAELAAVEDGLVAYGRLLEKLADVPTPAGPTPRDLANTRLVQLHTARGSPPQDLVPEGSHLQHRCSINPP